MLHRTQSQFSRRTLLAGSLAGAAMGCFHRGTHAQESTPTVEVNTPAVHLWVLASADELRPAAPVSPTQEELAELVQLQDGRDDAAIALIKQWNSRPAVLPWTEVANGAFVEFGLSALRGYRGNAIMQVAMADATTAALEAQQAYQAPLPATLDSSITPLAGIAPGAYAYPSAEAAVAGAAAAVLMALLPDAAPGRFTDQAQAAAETRLQAGLNTRADIDAGLALGKAIGERAAALAADDAPGSAWDGSGRLEGPGYWVPTPPKMADPLEPLAGTWHLWAMSSPDQFVLSPPPAYDSPGWRSQVAAVQEAVANRTLIQAEKAKYWQGSYASTLWNHYASELITRYQLPLDQATRVMAAQAVAVADAGVALWAAKYKYWVERPITADPEIDVLFPTPPFPSYPSAHGTVSNAAGAVLASLFPDDADSVLALANEATASRVWAGIHFPMDGDNGGAMGREIGYLVANLVSLDETA